MLGLTRSLGLHNSYIFSCSEDVLCPRKLISVSDVLHVPFCCTFCGSVALALAVPMAMRERGGKEDVLQYYLEALAGSARGRGVPSQSCQVNLYWNLCR